VPITSAIRYIKSRFCTGTPPHSLVPWTLYYFWMPMQATLFYML